jgi:hypothetical protein
MAYDGFSNIAGYNSQIVSGQKAKAKHVKAVIPGHLSMQFYDKTPTWAIIKTGTVTSTDVDKLVDSGATFISNGVQEGMIVKNTTDNCCAIVDVVQSESTLLLRADTQAGATTADIFTSGEGYNVYLSYGLSDAFAEYNGQIVNDSESPWNGKTLPNLNGAVIAAGKVSSGGTQRFIRSNVFSGATGGADTYGTTGSQATGVPNSYPFAPQPSTLLPSYFEGVAYVRIK